MGNLLKPGQEFTAPPRRPIGQKQPTSCEKCYPSRFSCAAAGAD